MSSSVEKEWLWFADQSLFSVREMGEVTYIYSLRSGNTHVFNAVSMAMLQYFVAAPRGVDELIAHFPDLMGVTREECPRGVIRRIFGELDDAGLVQPVEKRA
ncbi:hypothetical protein [Kordiimonas aestuarii]|uniref:hypothetical protein n=1 Tax=Kordiimonas aestuarii TaxID=1005925 RepID=UPI0021CFCC5E|nr:hypothetical protein [Kordiimonas aestuarii]